MIVVLLVSCSLHKPEKQGVPVNQTFNKEPQEALEAQPVATQDHVRKRSRLNLKEDASSGESSIMPEENLVPAKKREMVETSGAPAAVSKGIESHNAR